jgi:hypothetical protein
VKPAISHDKRDRLLQAQNFLLRMLQILVVVPAANKPSRQRLNRLNWILLVFVLVFITAFVFG